MMDTIFRFFQNFLLVMVYRVCIVTLCFVMTTVIGGVHTIIENENLTRCK